jgi:hypothetical protein
MENMIMKFSELEFKNTRDFELFGRKYHHKQAKVFFPNGYGVSIVQGTNTYGGEKGLYEIAVLQGNPESNGLCYTTPITNDVIGWLTESDVENYIKQVSEL